MPLRAARDQGDPSGELPVGRRQRELVQLERPVLGVEGVLLVQRRVVVDGFGAGHHADRVVVDVGGDHARPHVLARRPHAEAGNKNDPRGRIEQRLVGLDTARSRQCSPSV